MNWETGSDVLVEELDNANTVLLRVPKISQWDTTICTGLLDRYTPKSMNVLHLDFVKDPSKRLCQWKKYRNTPKEVNIINICPSKPTVGDKVINNYSEMDVTIDHVSDPTNLTQLGVNIIKRLNRLQATDHRTGVCFHSLTSFLQYIDSKSAFQFLNTLKTFLKSKNMHGHIHLEPNSYPLNTLTRFQPLFESFVDVKTDGKINIETGVEGSLLAD